MTTPDHGTTTAATTAAAQARLPHYSQTAILTGTGVLLALVIAIIIAITRSK